MTRMGPKSMPLGSIRLIMGTKTLYDYYLNILVGISKHKSAFIKKPHATKKILLQLFVYLRIKSSLQSSLSIDIT